MHAVNAAVLARAGGKFRCGKCQKIGNALEALFDEWPEAKDQGARPGAVPELSLTLPATPETESNGETEAADSPRRKRLVRVLWLVSALVLAVIITLNVLRFFYQPQDDSPWLQSTLIQLGLKQAAPEPPTHKPGQIELLNREMKPHPFRPGVLLLTATIVNRAAERQAYPDIDVTLLDLQGRQLERQLFKPGDYLSSSAELRSGMSPQAYLTFSLEMLDPGDGATGFELQFR